MEPDPLVGRGPLLTRLVEQLHVRALVAMNIGRAGTPQESGEVWTLRFLRRHMPGRRVVFDVGANEGHYAEAVLDVFGPDVDLHCFEPSKAASARLAERLRSRGATLHPFGLGAHEETRTLYADADGSVMGSLHPDAHAGALVAREQVDVRTLDRFCEERGIRRIDFLKLDVEGHEMSVLDGAARTLASGAVSAIQFEFGFRHLDSRTFFRDFHARLSPDHRIYRILRRGLRPIPRYREVHEVFLTTNFLALRKDAFPGKGA